MYTDRKLDGGLSDFRLFLFYIENICIFANKKHMRTVRISIQLFMY
jgi:hypothetical protein